MKKAVTRESNFELMRIISMLYIVIFHVMMHGGFFTKSSGAQLYVVKFIHCFVIIGVNSFIILTGYFQYNKKIKLTKILSINNATWFYKVLFLFLVLIFNIDIGYKISTIEKFQTLMPIDYGIYWYINCYIVLYLISPLLNKVIENTTKKQHIKIIVLLGLIFNIIPILTNQQAISSGTGRSTMNFIVLYFIGAYIAKYPIEEEFKNLSKTAISTISIIGYILCTILLTMCFCISESLLGLNSIATEIAKIFEGLYFSYSSPLMILETIFYFYIFKTMSFKNRIINNMAQCTIGIYLIHENIYVRDNLYKYIGFLKTDVIHFRHIPLIFAIAVVLFLISFVIEMIRLKVFKFIYNRKISKKIRNLYQGYFKKLGVNMPW